MRERFKLEPHGRRVLVVVQLVCGWLESTRGGQHQGLSLLELSGDVAVSLVRSCIYVRCTCGFAIASSFGLDDGPRAVTINHGDLLAHGRWHCKCLGRQDPWGGSHVGASQ